MQSKNLLFSSLVLAVALVGVSAQPSLAQTETTHPRILKAAAPHRETEEERLSKIKQNTSWRPFYDENGFFRGYVSPRPPRSYHTSYNEPQQEASTNPSTDVGNTGTPTHGSEYGYGTGYGYGAGFPGGNGYGTGSGARRSSSSRSGASNSLRYTASGFLAPGATVSASSSFQHRSGRSGSSRSGGHSGGHGRR
jgi:hypothetical protein